MAPTGVFAPRHRRPLVLWAHEDRGGDAPGARSARVLGYVACHAAVPRGTAPVRRDPERRSTVA